MKELFNSIFTEKIKLTIFLCCLVYLLLIYVNLWEKGEDNIDNPGPYFEFPNKNGSYLGLESSINTVGKYMYSFSLIIVSVSIIVSLFSWIKEKLISK